MNGQTVTAWHARRAAGRSCVRGLVGGLLLAAGAVAASAQARVTTAGARTYSNPVLPSDYSDPDVIRVGDDFYMTSSSFGEVPGLPILHSRDLVHWQLVGHALLRLPAAFDAPQHGLGVWAPSLRYHDGWYWIYYADPDRGVYMVKTRDPRSRWEDPVLVHAATGWEDPCPFWDDDGRAWLVHAFAGSRAGIKSVLHIAGMSPDGTRLLDAGKLVFDGHARQPTIEGPKLYKRDGWYYIFAPAGGVTSGWQTVLRARDIMGPYEDRIVMAQGQSGVNGPHQGGWVHLRDGTDWFLHFQDRGAFGRVVHLQPMRWRRDGWPVIGDDPEDTGTGTPVARHRAPFAVLLRGVALPQSSDEFDGPSLGLQWSWSANPQAGWWSLGEAGGSLRLFAQPLASESGALWLQPNVLLQKLPSTSFWATTEVSLPSSTGTTAGLVMLGMDEAYIAVRRTTAGMQVVHARAAGADRGHREVVSDSAALSGPSVRLRVVVDSAATCRFSFSADGRRWQPLGQPFIAAPGRWVGARLGLFAVLPASSTARPADRADFAFFRTDPNLP